MIESLCSALICLATPAAYLSPWVWRQGRMTAIRKHVTQNKLLALTYDDGPSEDLTPQLLDLLQENNAVATFFMLGRNARACPHLADRIVREGHDVGCHSDQHLNALTAAPWRAVRDINTGYRELSPWLRSNGMFRPPYGKMTLPTYLTIRHRRASVWWWTIDSGDTQKTLPAPQEVVEQVARENGGIVLMHDMKRSVERNAFVLETTESLLKLAKQNSIHVVALRNLCL